VERRRVVIIGAGPTGLGAAWRLASRGQRDVVVLEQEPQVGGLARSVVDEHGFTWDLGGHVQFSHYPLFDELMETALGKDGWYHHQREAWAWMRDRFVPYPVQYNLRHFPPDEQVRAVRGLLELSHRPKSDPRNFREWILATFGEGLAESFLFPYNWKVWAWPPERLSADWVGERVAVVDLDRALKSLALEVDDVSWGPNNTFAFPKQGGTGAVWRAVGRLLGEGTLRLGVSVRGVDAAQKTVELSTGERLGYDVLISTMPVDLLVARTSGLGAGAVQAAGLVHSSTHVVGLGLRGQPPPSLRSKCWLYFPEDLSPFYRVTVFSNYSPATGPAPGSTWSLMTETSESPAKPVNGALVEATIEGALACKLIESRAQVLSTWHHRIEHGYPTPSVERDAQLAAALPALEARDIYSRGRFGAWRYEVANQDHSLMQGVELVDRLLDGVPEKTVGSWGSQAPAPTGPVAAAAARRARP